MTDESRTERQDASAMETVRKPAGLKSADGSSTMTASGGIRRTLRTSASRTRRAFTVEARSGEASSTLDAAPVEPTPRPAELNDEG